MFIRKKKKRDWEGLQAWLEAVCNSQWTRWPSKNVDIWFVDFKTSHKPIKNGCQHDSKMKFLLLDVKLVGWNFEMGIALPKNLKKSVPVKLSGHNCVQTFGCLSRAFLSFLYHFNFPPNWIWKCEKPFFEKKKLHPYWFLHLNCIPIFPVYSYPSIPFLFPPTEQLMIFKLIILCSTCSFCDTFYSIMKLSF